MPRGRSSRLEVYFSLSLTMLLWSNAAFANVHVGAYGAKRESCQPTLSQVVDSLRQVSFPDEWTVIVACTDTAWSTALMVNRATGASEMAVTNAAARWTLVNGAVWDRMRNRSRYSPEMVLRHELGHIRCGCRDERRADQAGGSK